MGHSDLQCQIVLKDIHMETVLQLLTRTEGGGFLVLEEEQLVWLQSLHTQALADCLVPLVIPTFLCECKILMLERYISTLLQYVQVFFADFN